MEYTFEFTTFLNGNDLRENFCEGIAIVSDKKKETTIEFKLLDTDNQDYFDEFLEHLSTEFSDLTKNSKKIKIKQLADNKFSFNMNDLEDIEMVLINVCSLFDGEMEVE